MDELDLVILKTILNNRKCALEFVNDCDEKLFTADLWRFAKLVIDCIRVYKEVPTQKVLIERAQTLKNAAFVEHINTIFTKLTSINHDEKEYRHNLAKLKQRFSEKLISTLKETLNPSDIKKNVNEIQSTLNSIKNINQTKIYKEGSLKDYSRDFINIYNQKLKDPNFNVGIKTGYTFIDYVNAGMRPGELLIFAGITNSGKSLLLMNTAIQMWLGNNNIDMRDNFQKGCNVLLFSLEMNYEDYMQRAVARIAMVPQHNIRDAKLETNEKSRINSAFKFVNSYGNYFKVIDLPRKATIETIEMIVEEQEELYGKPDVVVIDYLNLMDVAANGGETQDWLIQGKISENLHEFARTKGVIAISAIQLNPKGGQNNGDFGIKDFRRSTQISDNCDMIIIMNTRKDEKNYPQMQLSMVKNRRGPLANASLHKYLECCAILDTAYNPDVDPEDISGIVGS